MVSVATKIGMFTMLSTMALGRELTSEDPLTPEQELGNDLIGLLTDLRVDIDEMKTSRDEMSGMLDSLQLQMDLLESK